MINDIPAWLLECEDNIATGGARTGFLRKTAAAVSGILKNELLAERFAAKNMFLQGIDPRLKLITMLPFMVMTGMLKSFSALILLCVVAFMLAELSGLGIFNYFKRVWMVFPLLVLVISIPAATNLFIPGRNVLTIFGGHNAGIWFLKFPDGLFFTSEGIAIILKMSLRVGVSLSFGYLLVMTTRWSYLTRSLRTLKIPRVVITILDMTYRYIFVLVQISIEIFEARYLRTVGKVRNRDNRRFIAGGIAYLFVKASHMSTEIYDSMLCRCYCGEPVGIRKFGFTRNDVVWAGDFSIIVIIILLFCR